MVGKQVLHAVAILVAALLVSLSLANEVVVCPALPQVAVDRSVTFRNCNLSTTTLTVTATAPVEVQFIDVQLLALSVTSSSTTQAVNLTLLRVAIRTTYTNSIALMGQLTITQSNLSTVAIQGTPTVTLGVEISDCNVSKQVMVTSLTTRAGAVVNITNNVLQSLLVTHMVMPNGTFSVTSNAFVNGLVFQGDRIALSGSCVFSLNATVAISGNTIIAPFYNVTCPWTTASPRLVRIDASTWTMAALTIANNSILPPAAFLPRLCDRTPGMLLSSSVTFAKSNVTVMAAAQIASTFASSTVLFHPNTDEASSSTLFFDVSWTPSSTSKLTVLDMGALPRHAGDVVVSLSTDTVVVKSSTLIADGGRMTIDGIFNSLILNWNGATALVTDVVVSSGTTVSGPLSLSGFRQVSSVTVESNAQVNALSIGDCDAVDTLQLVRLPSLSSLILTRVTFASQGRALLENLSGAVSVSLVNVAFGAFASFTLRHSSLTTLVMNAVTLSNFSAVDVTNNEWPGIVNVNRIAVLASVFALGSRLVVAENTIVASNANDTVFFSSSTWNNATLAVANNSIAAAAAAPSSSGRPLATAVAGILLDATVQCKNRSVLRIVNNTIYGPSAGGGAYSLQVLAALTSVAVFAVSLAPGSQSNLSMTVAPKLPSDVAALELWPFVSQSAVVFGPFSTNSTLTYHGTDGSITNEMVLDGVYNSMAISCTLSSINRLVLANTLRLQSVLYLTGFTALEQFTTERYGLIYGVNFAPLGTQLAVINLLDLAVTTSITFVGVNVASNSLVRVTNVSLGGNLTLRFATLRVGSSVVVSSCTVNGLAISSGLGRGVSVVVAKCNASMISLANISGNNCRLVVANNTLSTPLVLTQPRLTFSQLVLSNSSHLVVSNNTAVASYSYSWAGVSSSNCKPQSFDTLHFESSIITASSRVCILNNSVVNASAVGSQKTALPLNTSVSPACNRNVAVAWAKGAAVSVSASVTFNSSAALIIAGNDIWTAPVGGTSIAVTSLFVGNASLSILSGDMQPLDWVIAPSENSALGGVQLVPALPSVAGDVTVGPFPFAQSVQLGDMASNPLLSIVGSYASLALINIPSVNYVALTAAANITGTFTVASFSRLQSLTVLPNSRVGSIAVAGTVSNVSIAEVVLAALTFSSFTVAATATILVSRCQVSQLTLQSGTLTSASYVVVEGSSLNTIVIQSVVAFKHSSLVLWNNTFDVQLLTSTSRLAVSGCSFNASTLQIVANTVVPVYSVNSATVSTLSFDTSTFVSMARLLITANTFAALKLTAVSALGKAASTGTDISLTSAVQVTLNSSIVIINNTVWLWPVTKYAIVVSSVFKTGSTLNLGYGEPNMTIKAVSTPPALAGLVDGLSLFDALLMLTVRDSLLGDFPAVTTTASTGICALCSECLYASFIADLGSDDTDEFNSNSNNGGVGKVTRTASLLRLASPTLRHDLSTVERHQTITSTAIRRQPERTRTIPVLQTSAPSQAAVSSQEDSDVVTAVPVPDAQKQATVVTASIGAAVTSGASSAVGGDLQVSILLLGTACTGSDLSSRTSVLVPLHVPSQDATGALIGFFILFGAAAVVHGLLILIARSHLPNNAHDVVSGAKWLPPLPLIPVFNLFLPGMAIVAAEALVASNSTSSVALAVVALAATLGTLVYTRWCICRVSSLMPPDSYGGGPRLSDWSLYQHRHQLVQVFFPRGRWTRTRFSWLHGSTFRSLSGEVSSPTSAKAFVIRWFPAFTSLQLVAVAFVAASDFSKVCPTCCWLKWAVLAGLMILRCLIVVFFRPARLPFATLNALILSGSQTFLCVMAAINPTAAADFSYVLTTAVHASTMAAVANYVVLILEKFAKRVFVLKPAATASSDANQGDAQIEVPLLEVPSVPSAVAPSSSVTVPDAAEHTTILPLPDQHKAPDPANADRAVANPLSSWQHAEPR